MMWSVLHREKEWTREVAEPRSNQVAEMNVRIKCEKNQRCQEQLGHLGVAEAKEESISRS